MTSEKNEKNVLENQDKMLIVEQEIKDENDDKIIAELETEAFDSKKEEEISKSLFSEVEQERELEEEVADNINYYTTVFHNIPVLKPEEELMYAKMAKDGATEEERAYAKNKLVEHNMRYVLKIAQRFTNTELSQDDIIQEGAIGLMCAAEKFDYTKGFRFTTYATWWIRQRITRSICDHGRSIRIPVHMHEDMRRLRRAETMAEQKQLSGKEAEEFIIEQTQLTKEKIAEIRVLRQGIVSLDTPVGNEGGEDSDSVLGDFVADNKTLSPEESAISNNISESLREVMKKCLTKKEYEVICYRFGLGEEKPMTLNEVGEVYGVTRERIRQIEEKALRKMRNPKYRLRINFHN